MNEFARNPVVYAGSVAAVVVGLALVLAAEGLGYGDGVLIGGGVVGLAGVALLTLAVAKLDGPEEAGHGGH
jgi:peptidoglycan/LPS O-acetylase OafA/YrhL